jgi:hypothetical protein
VSDERSARLDVARARLSERAREGDQLVGRNRGMLRPVELLTQDRSIEFETHRDGRR